MDLTDVLRGNVHMFSDRRNRLIIGNTSALAWICTVLNMPIFVCHKNRSTLAVDALKFGVLVSRGEEII